MLADGLKMSGRGPNGDKTMSLLELTTGPGQSMFYAYPASYGYATFLDLDSQMEGGWDGAFFMTTGDLGPITVNVNVAGVGVVPFYLYKSDWPNLGYTRWQVY